MAVRPFHLCQFERNHLRLEQQPDSLYPSNDRGRWLHWASHRTFLRDPFVRRQQCCRPYRRLQQLLPAPAARRICDPSHDQRTEPRSIQRSDPQQWECGCDLCTAQAGRTDRCHCGHGSGGDFRSDRDQRASDYPWTILGNVVNPLASPWGITLAPAGFGPFSGDLLVGNFSYLVSEINAFDPNGNFLGTISD